jgi:glyoxylase-like metal-dependent hydrolase (beta-lactamase superfamily II)
MRHPAAASILGDGDVAGPLRAVHVPGHAADHLVFVYDDRLAFTGDAVLGVGSVFIAPDGGSLGGYLDGLRRLRALRLERLLPGHGPIVEDPDTKLGEYIAHRLERERRIVAALESGARTEDELLAAAWDHIPEGLHLPALWTLRAHLAKLEDDKTL